MFRSFFAVWDFPPVVCAELALISLIYTLGFLRIQKTRPRQFPSWRWYCFMGGILALVVAVSSPLDTFSDRLLVVHMGQHFVLMSIAPPLIVFGAPVVPMLRGLPRWFVRPVLGPLIRIRWLREFFHALVQPKVAWLLMNLVYIGWHVPAAYEAALANENIHNIEHACFFFTSVLFWWPIIEPWPSRFRGSRWILLPYLLAADVVNTGISAFLVFSAGWFIPATAPSLECSALARLPIRRQREHSCGSLAPSSFLSQPLRLPCNYCPAGGRKAGKLTLFADEWNVANRKRVSQNKSNCPIADSSILGRPSLDKKSTRKIDLEVVARIQSTER